MYIIRHKIKRCVYEISVQAEKKLVYETAVLKFSNQNVKKYIIDYQ